MILRETTGPPPLITVFPEPAPISLTLTLIVIPPACGGIVGGVFYAASDDRKIHAIDIASHTETWSTAVKGAPSAPAIVDGRIIVGTSLGQVVSIVGTRQPSGASTTP